MATALLWFLLALTAPTAAAASEQYATGGGAGYGEYENPGLPPEDYADRLADGGTLDYKTLEAHTGNVDMVLSKNSENSAVWQKRVEKQKRPKTPVEDDVDNIDKYRSDEPTSKYKSRSTVIKIRPRIRTMEAERDEADVNKYTKKRDRHFDYENDDDSESDDSNEELYPNKGDKEYTSDIRSIEGGNSQYVIKNARSEKNSRHRWKYKNKDRNERQLEEDRKKTGVKIKNASRRNQEDMDYPVQNKRKQLKMSEDSPQYESDRYHEVTSDEDQVATKRSEQRDHSRVEDYSDYYDNTKKRAKSNPLSQARNQKAMSRAKPRALRSLDDESVVPLSALSAAPDPDHRRSHYSTEGRTRTSFGFADIDYSGPEQMVTEKTAPDPKPITTLIIDNVMKPTTTDKSRLSILAKAQKKEGPVLSLSTNKPPVLMLVAPPSNEPDEKIKEPPNYRRFNPYSESRDKLDKVKAIMRAKINKNQTIKAEVDKLDWDDLVCDYVRESELTTGCFAPDSGISLLVVTAWLLYTFTSML